MGDGLDVAVAEEVDRRRDVLVGVERRHGRGLDPPQAGEGHGPARGEDGEGLEAGRAVAAGRLGLNPDREGVLVGYAEPSGREPAHLAAHLRRDRRGVDAVDRQALGVGEEPVLDPVERPGGHHRGDPADGHEPVLYVLPQAVEHDGVGTGDHEVHGRADCRQRCRAVVEGCREADARDLLQLGEDPSLDRPQRLLALEAVHQVDRHERLLRVAPGPEREHARFGPQSGRGHGDARLLPDRLLRGSEQRFGAIEGGVGVALEGDAEDPGVHRRHQVAADHWDHDPTREDQEHDRRNDEERLVSQRHCQGLDEELLDRVEHLVLDDVVEGELPAETLHLAAEAEDERCQDRQNRDRDEVRGDQRDRQGQAQRPQYGLHEPADPDDRHQHHDRGVGAGEDCEHDLLGPADDGVLELLPELLIVALDVLEHHDGVVEQHAHPEDDAGQRHHVELETEQPHEGEGDEIGEGDRDPRQQHPPGVGEEEEDDDHGHDDGVAQGVDHVRHAGGDQLALGVGDGELEPRILLLQLRQMAEHGLDRRQRVAGEGALDVDADRRLAVAVERRQAFLDADVDVGDVPEVDRRSG